MNNKIDHGVVIDTAGDPPSPQETKSAESGKQKAVKPCRSLHAAFLFVEEQQAPADLRSACGALEHIKDFRPAIVAYADKVPMSLLEESNNDADDNMLLSETEKAAFLELEHASSYRCCRGQAGLEGAVLPSEVLALAEPAMKDHPNPTKLSQVSNIVELLLSYADVDFAADNNAPEMAQWERYVSWVEKACVSVPLMLDIVDPSCLLIRDPTGGPPPAGAIHLLNSLPVAAGAAAAGALHAVPVQVARPNGGGVPVVGLYRFASRDDAGVARVALAGWAATQVPAVNLDILRFSTTNAGFEWF